MERVSTHSLEEMSPTMECLSCLWDPLSHAALQWTIISIDHKFLRADVRMDCGPFQQLFYLQVIDLNM